MTATDSHTMASATTASQTQAFDRIDEAIEGLRALRKLTAERPDIAESVIKDLSRDTGTLGVFVYIDERGAYPLGCDAEIVALGQSAMGHGATLTRKDSKMWRGVEASFGIVKLHVYTETVGEVAS